MFVIKKTSLYFNKSIILQSVFITKGFLAFFDYFEMVSFNFFSFKNFVILNKFDFFFLNSSFISFFFSNMFFNFLKPGLFLISGSSLNDFFVFNNKVKDSFSFFLVGFCFNTFFFNYNFLLDSKRILDIFNFKFFWFFRHFFLLVKFLSGIWIFQSISLYIYYFYYWAYVKQ